MENGGFKVNAFLVYFWLLLAAIFGTIAPPVNIRCIKYRKLINLVILRFARWSREIKCLAELGAWEWVWISYPGVQYDLINVVAYCLERRAVFTYQTSICYWSGRSVTHLLFWLDHILVDMSIIIWYGYKNLWTWISVSVCIESIGGGGCMWRWLMYVSIMFENAVEVADDRDVSMNTYM